MAKERLSKLQKWILIFLYNHGDCFVSTQALKNYAHRDENPFNPGTRRNAIEVVFSRSLRSLYYKQLIEASSINGREPSGRCQGRRKNFGDEGNIKLAYLTDEGKAKAKELLNVKN